MMRLIIITCTLAWVQLQEMLSLGVRWLLLMRQQQWIKYSLPMTQMLIVSYWCLEIKVQAVIYRVVWEP